MDPALPSPRELLRQSFGFESFLPGQESIVDHLLSGHSAAAVFPTGGGKSLCYQLPALTLPGLTLVVSPLIALMKDQIDALRRRGIAAARLDSTLDLAEYREVMAGVRSGALRMLYVAPERFNNERFRQAMESIEISLFAVDEAHCISEWGHNFRPDYLKLAGYAESFNAGRVLALTATAPPKVLEDICRGFQIAPEHAVRTGFYRPNLTLRMTPTDAASRDDALLERMRERPPGPGIVYVTLQKTAEDVAARLSASGLEAYAYHAGMKNDERARVQERFLASDHALVVATIAFGMGIDKSNIRYVDHYNLPKSLENLSQEIGRAGRDGEPSFCEILVCPEDRNVLENFAYGDTPSERAVRELVNALFPALETDGSEPDGGLLDLSLYTLAHRHDIRILVLRTLLTYLELEGYLEASTPVYSNYRFKPKVASKEILERFSGDRREFLRGIFRQTKRRGSWMTLDLESAAAILSQPRDRLVRALDYLAEQGMLELEAAGVRHPYRRLRRPQDLEMLASELHARSLEREEREISRLEQVLELAAFDSCQTGALSAYFGEALAEPCGHCSFCLDGAPAELLPDAEVEIDEAQWAEALKLRESEDDALGDARAFTRFLVGLSSPRASRRKLGSHRLFGCLAAVSFGEVLERVEMVEI